MDGGGVVKKVSRRRLFGWIGRGARPVEAPRVRAARALSASQLIVLLAVIALGATLLCAGLGYGLARQSDERFAAEQRHSLRNAISEFRAVFGRSNELDPRLVRMVERSAGLKSLRFETEPVPGSREIQPVLDIDGRIAGFFTWESSHPMSDTMARMSSRALLMI